MLFDQGVKNPVNTVILKLVIIRYHLAIKKNDHFFCVLFSSLADDGPRSHTTEEDERKITQT